MIFSCEDMLLVDSPAGLVLLNRLVSSLKKRGAKSLVLFSIESCKIFCSCWVYEIDAPGSELPQGVTVLYCYQNGYNVCMSKSTNSEKWVEHFIEQNGWLFEREPKEKENEKSPDYAVWSSSKTILLNIEVTSISHKMEWDTDPDSLVSTSTLPSGLAAEKIRKKITTKYRKVRDLLNPSILVLALCDDNPANLKKGRVNRQETLWDSSNLAGVLFGDRSGNTSLFNPGTKNKFSKWSAIAWLEVVEVESTFQPRLTVFSNPNAQYEIPAWFLKAPRVHSITLEKHRSPDGWFSFFPEPRHICLPPYENFWTKDN